MINHHKKILNIGCGNETYGTDFVDKYPMRKDIKKCDLDREKLPYKNNTFDVVFSKNFFEHIKNQGQVLKEMVRVTKKGGKIVVITDNASFLFWKKDVYPEGYGQEDQHFSLFTPEHMANHFKTLNLKNIKVKYRSGFVKHFHSKVLLHSLSYLFPNFFCSTIEAQATK